MIDRYTRPKMKAIWELKRKYEIWLAVELAACAAFERAAVPRGTCPVRSNAAQAASSTASQISYFRFSSQMAFILGRV